MSEELQKGAFVGVLALKLFETTLDNLSFEEFPAIDATTMAVLRAHVNEVRDPNAMTAWINHDRLRRHTRLSVSAIKEAIKRLEAAGLMKHVGHQAKGIKVYQLHLPGVTTESEPPDASASPRTTSKAPQRVSAPRTTTNMAVSAWPELEDSYV